MDKFTETKQHTQETTASAEVLQMPKNNETTETAEPVEAAKKATNPIKNSDSRILKNLAKFSNQKLSKKFNINELFR